VGYVKTYPWLVDRSNADSASTPPPPSPLRGLLSESSPALFQFRPRSWPARTAAIDFRDGRASRAAVTRPTFPRFPEIEPTRIVTRGSLSRLSGVSGSVF